MLSLNLEGRRCVELVRCFVAVGVGGPAARALLACQRELKACGASVKWTAPEQLHLTLKFLGEVQPATVAAAREALAPLFTREAPFTLTLSGLGAFPSPARAQVLWAGVTEGRETLTRLAAAAEAALVPAGVPAENRPFKPHLTLGRVREGGLSPALVEAVTAGRGRAFGATQVEQVVLMRSRLTPQGPVYTPLFTFALRGERAVAATGQIV